MKIFVDCVNENCGKEFDILIAKSCKHDSPTRVCPHCGKCVCDITPTIDTNIVLLSPPIRGVSYLIVKREFVKGKK